MGKKMKMKLVFFCLLITSIDCYPGKVTLKQKILSRKKRFIPVVDPVANVIAGAELANSIVQTGLMAAELANSHRQTDLMIKELAESRKGNRLAESANWIAEKDLAESRKGNRLAESANLIAEKELAQSRIGNRLAESANWIAEKELSESRKGNRLAVRANWIAEKANILANESNQIAERGNQLSQKANDISREANEIARAANYIARMNLDVANKANYLSQKQIIQDTKIAIMTLDQERRLADASSELDIMLNKKMTNSISTGLADVAAAIRDGLDKVADIISKAKYFFEINQTKMVASILHTTYTDYMLHNRDAHLSRTEVMKIMQKKFDDHLDDMEKLINEQSFNLNYFLHIAHLNIEQMNNKDCQWMEVRSQGFAINTMFMVLNQTIKKRNVTMDLVPQIFEDEGIRFFKSFVNFNIKSSYEFDTRCFKDKVCFDSHFTKMPSESHCYDDKEKIAKYCDFSISCEEDQATIKREKLKEADRYFAICLMSFASRDCERFKTEASEFIANLPTCFLKKQSGL